MAYIGREPQIGNFQVCDAISVVNGQAAYTMQVSSVNVSPETANHMIVSLNGIIQAPGSSYTVSGSTITFASNLATGDVINFIHILGSVLDLGVPSDATVTDAKTNFVSTSSAAGLQIKGDGTTDGTLQLNCSQNSHGIKLKSPPHSASASYTLTFPNNDGDANQVLTTNGSGVLSFADAGGGSFTKIANADYSSAVSTFTYTNCFTTTYSVYKFYMFDIDAAASNDELEIKFLDSGGSVVGNWRQVATEIYKEQGGTGSGTGVFTAHGNNFIRCSHNDLTASTTQPSHLEMTIFLPYESKYTTVHNRFFLRADNGYNYAYDQYAFLESTTSLRSMTIYQDGGTNFASYKSTIYGLTR